MFLQALPLVFVLGGVILYVVLGGADFGAGACRLFAGRGKMGERIRDHAQHSMGPVWEANHVWLIFVLTVTWTAYPRVFGSIASTLGLALFIAVLGIVVRGASYALRSIARSERDLRRIDTAFGLVSLLSPFMFGAAAGALASERVPLGNATGGLWSSWTGPISIVIGVLSVFFSAYMAAVFLAADAVRHNQPDLVAAMRRRAIFAGGAAGVMAVVGLIVIHADAHSLYAGLIHGVGLIAIIVSALFGLGTVGLVFLERYEWARYSSAIAVACVIAGWAAARWPVLLPDATVFNSAASHDTLVCVVVAVIGGGILLFPSMGLLFSLTLRGQLSSEELEGEDETAVHRQRALNLSGSLLVRGGPRLALVLLIVGVGMLNAANAGWCHIIGATSLFLFVVTGFLTIIATTVESQRGGETAQLRPE